MPKKPLLPQLCILGDISLLSISLKCVVLLLRCFMRVKIAIYHYPKLDI